jgi:hypothetical protein
MKIYTTNFELSDGRIVSFDSKSESLDDAIDFAIEQLQKRYGTSRVDAIKMCQGGTFVTVDENDNGR